MIQWVPTKNINIISITKNINECFETKHFTNNGKNVELTQEKIRKIFKIDDNREVALSLGIRSIPTVKMFNSGEVVETKVGLMNEGQIKEMVSELING